MLIAIKDNSVQISLFIIQTVENRERYVHVCGVMRKCVNANMTYVNLRWVFKDCFSQHDDLRWRENRFLGPTSTLEASFHAGVGRHADRNNF